MKLAKIKLGPDWIDLSYGEPVVVLNALNRTLNCVGSQFKLPGPMDIKTWQYQHASGYPPLRELLEARYGSKVIITNGAKQGLLAVMHAMKKQGHTAMTIPKPFWASTPEIIKNAGLAVEYTHENNNYSRALLITSPNNPDGKELSKDQLQAMVDDANNSGVTLLHDAAYYTPIYMKNPSEAFAFGSAQVYSFAKMYGTAGLRIGYVVVHDESLIPGIYEYMEETTTGVSILSQKAALEIEEHFLNNPNSLHKFHAEARKSITESRKIFTQVNPEVLKVPADFCESNQMFGWVERGPKLNAEVAKVNLVEGSIFGDHTKVRVNLGLPTETIAEAVARLNKI